ncbi:PAS domain-containing sensor histidine kinase [Flaviaesturariibacter aridisoli]|uniref:histidine kinase n=1 Tax=Flaviaesturariibacter aridisoli TaxID=2545761 RepID=A0A4R4E455_9BACT|nr:PAS domain-containing protein [Flaviaesturariibacter aridisoli]TCZ71415.1 PAS domain S-box protein [Flaviaesturariibacter aridisoli]
MFLNASGPSPLASDPNLTGLFMQAPAMICILEGADLRCTFTNPLFSRLYEGKVLLGRTPREVAPELEGQGYFEMLDRVYTSGEAVYGYEFPGVADWNNEGRDTTKYFNMVYAPYKDGARTAGVMIFGFEVTEQVLARQRTEREEERIRRMVDALPLMAWTAGPEGAISYLNARWYAYTGQEPETALGSGWISAVPSSERGELAERWNKCLIDGTPYEAETRYRRHDGVLRWHSARAEPIRDTDGTILYWLGVSHDIHDQKTDSENLERLVSERTLALQRSNEELEQFAFIASHDLKEPLRKILFFSGRLQEDVREGGQPYLQRIRDAATRMRTLVDDLLEFSGVQTAPDHFEPVDLNDVLAASLQDHELRIQELGAVVEAAPLPVVRGLQHQLLQLFTNLVGNALKYNRPGETPRLQVEAQAASPAELARFPELPACAPFHSIRFRDNGIGFEPAEAERIFTLFQRLHSRSNYSGTGVGLALCRKVARAHGGGIYAEGERGAGAVFHVLLPA